MKYLLVIAVAVAMVSAFPVEEQSGKAKRGVLGLHGPLIAPAPILAPAPIIHAAPLLSAAPILAPAVHAAPLIAPAPLLLGHGSLIAPFYGKALLH